MLQRDEVVTAYKALLGRDPEAESVIESHCRGHDQVDSLVMSICASEEFKMRLRPPAHAAATPKTLTRTQLIGIYEELLRRKPGSEDEISQHLASHDTPEAFRQTVLDSQEYRNLQTFSTKRKIQFSEIDKEVALLERLSSEDPIEYSARLNDFWLDLKPINEPPSSDAYKQWVMATYSEIANRSYGTSNEVTDYDVDAYTKRPVPYASGNAKAIGDQLMAVGHVIHAMNLPANSSVLEMGFGWGNTTVQLAMSGYQVKGIDISRHFVEIASRRVRALQIEPDLSVGDFFDIETIDDKFDAVLFFECFHHCADHLRLLKAIPKVLKPGGRLVLAGETINNALPYPWGINPDGQAIYCIRRFGWLELSFRENYILGLLDELGWNVTKHNFINAMGVTYVATRKGE
ncbi:Methyltransferase domain-containing protein [Variovorax sp. YR750]|uniref:class I SAM-dependent methyltransferase n=1 Tax=Variovorax sp. YR750 TaxID=1884384 RepID=UPI0008CC5106|nr:class I SAM-dependent methyltransferase [Variovorax sp. YR750]MDP9604714.1 2-polyprenyl-3-methyl-5-hydroxy-6-metoxy-1,4-benzoquinol methylase [Variovorax paradoxus]SEL29201.1 Methyltransferase domain-containing protein [Variovorax sp. YR750]